MPVSIPTHSSDWRNCQHCEFGEELERSRMQGRHDRLQYLNLGIAPKGAAAEKLGVKEIIGNPRVALDLWLRGAQKGEYQSPDNPQASDTDEATVDSVDELRDIIKSIPSSEDDEIQVRRNKVALEVAELEENQ